MWVKIFDTHCHLAHEELKAQASELVERALSLGVKGFAIIAADTESLREAPKITQSLKKKFPQGSFIYSAGIHPHDSKDLNETLWKEVFDYASKAQAIGETGLDYHYNFSEQNIQQDAFKRHIDLAIQLSKPLVIHCREAAEDIVKILSESEIRKHPNPGILHCFTEDWKVAEKLLDLNFYISFSGILTFKNAKKIWEVAQKTPLEKILIETDAPWLAPMPYRGKQNEPAYVKNTFEFFCTLRKESPQEIMQKLWENSCRVFGVAA